MGTSHAILSFVQEFVRERGYPPSLAEISEAVGVVPSAVGHHLKRLESQGRLRREPRKHRAITLLEGCNEGTV